jgi:hypothetical protein
MFLRRRIARMKSKTEKEVKRPTPMPVTTETKREEPEKKEVVPEVFKLGTEISFRD